VSQKPVELILLRQWASYLSTPIFVVGADGALVYYNEPAETLLGRTFDEAGEMPLRDVSAIFEITDEAGAPMSLSEFPLGIAWQEHRPAHGRVRYRALDGPWRIVDVTALPIEGHDEQHLGAVAIFWEVNSH
jgi:PAS domain-containing protein